MNKFLIALFVGALALGGGACVNVTVDDDNNGGGGGANNGGGGGTGSSGVSSTKKATDLTDEEEQTFCEWFTELAEPKQGQEFQCDNDITITIEPFSETQCEMELANNPGCPIGDLEDCFETLIEDPCLLASETQPAECAGLEQCAQDTGSNNVTVNNTGDEFCYDHDCNGDATGEQCFSTFEDYCDSLCLETNCISVEACEAECGF